jgi:GTP-binding protein LepA
MIFDSVYDSYRGVDHLRAHDRRHLSPRERIQMMSTRATTSSSRSVVSPEPTPTKGLASARSAT